jgi:hypothetical protein
VGNLLTPLIEDEIKKCIETHVAPIKEAIDKQQKPLIQIKRKYVNSTSGLIDLTNKQSKMKTLFKSTILN